MAETDKLIRVKTDRDGIILKTVTELDDAAWFIVNRPYVHPLPPSAKEAPDYIAFSRLRWQRRKDDPSTVRMGIWDAKRFKRPIFAGYVELHRKSEPDGTAQVGCIVAETYRGYGYATTALQAIMKYGRENLDLETYKAEVREANYASREMVEKLGFEVVRENLGTLTYALGPPGQTISP